MSKVWKIFLNATHSNGVQVQPTWHYQTDLPLADPTKEEPDGTSVAQHVWDHLSGTLVPATSSDITLHELVALEEVVPPVIGGSGAYGIGLAGLYPLAGGDLSHALVPLINFHTNTRSRSARGWQFLGAPRRAEDCNGDDWDQTTALWAALLAYCAKLDDDILYSTVFPDVVLHPVVYSRQRHRLNQAPYTFQITSASPNPQQRWLKSRLSSP